MLYTIFNNLYKKSTTNWISGDWAVHNTIQNVMFSPCSNCLRFAWHTDHIVNTKWISKKATKTKTDITRRRKLPKTYILFLSKLILIQNDVIIYLPPWLSGLSSRWATVQWAWLASSAGRGFVSHLCQHVESGFCMLWDYSRARYKRVRLCPR